MIAIDNFNETGKNKCLIADMTDGDINFNAKWVHHAGWKVVPVESGMRFSGEDISKLVSALNDRGFFECLAVATEPLDPLPCCYRMLISEGELHEFNRVCGLFRFLITDLQRRWAVSCSEWYNLFAGPQGLLEAMLGKSIEDARSEFLNYAASLARSPDDPLLKIARHYEML